MKTQKWYLLTNDSEIKEGSLLAWPSQNGLFRKAVEYSRVNADATAEYLGRALTSSNTPLILCEVIKYDDNFIVSRILNYFTWKETLEISADTLAGGMNAFLAVATVMKEEEK